MLDQDFDLDLVKFFHTRQALQLSSDVFAAYQYGLDISYRPSVHIYLVHELYAFLLGWFPFEDFKEHMAYLFR